MWGFTPDESDLYLDFCRREVMFREGVLYFLGDRSYIKGKTKGPASIEDKFCEACKVRFRGEQDCSTCDRNIQVIEDA
jgi:hypothetical protein